jgi:hypothetical protein
VLAIAIAPVMVALVADASAQACRQVIVKHGYLSQAQSECDFDYFNEEAVIDAANRCKVPKDVSGQLLKQGMESAIAEHGKAKSTSAWCAGVVKRHAQDVRP